MDYRVVLRPKALAAFRDLDRRMRARVRRTLQQLAEHPRHAGTRKLSGRERIYRARVGGLRVLYRIEDADRVVDILWIGPRGQAYRH